MFYFAARSLRFLVTAALSETSPRRLAWGAALGLWLGLVPKGNLLAITLAMLVASLRINLGLCLGVAFVASFAAILLDPAAHQLGLLILTNDALEPIWDWLYRKPFVPWTSFNNTVVLGQFVIGMLIAAPAAYLLTPLCERIAPKVFEKLERYRVSRWLYGMEWAERLGGETCDGNT